MPAMVSGIEQYFRLPREEIISGYVVNAGIMDCVNAIAAEMKIFLERIPPQIAYHISREGIYLTGGSTRIPYIDNYLASYTGVSFNLSPFYEKSTICGLEKIIRDRDLRNWAQPSNNVNYNFLRGMIHEKPEKEISISNTFKE